MAKWLHTESLTFTRHWKSVRVGLDVYTFDVIEKPSGCEVEVRNSDYRMICSYKAKNLNDAYEYCKRWEKG